MTDYDLYYWPIPFRGQFVRAALAFAGKTWTEHSDIPSLMRGAMADMPAPFMGPPVLVDHKAKFAVSQTTAILLYLGETLALLPSDPAAKATTLKVVADAVDVIDDLTLDGGRLMWTEPRWREFQPRLRKWMGLFEEVGRRHALKARSGHLLGSEAPGLADITTAVLWSTMTERFPEIGAILDDAAPHVAALSRRIAARPELAALADKARRDYGETYCGGQIEASLRKVMA